jgi:hypothetical protein
MRSRVIVQAMLENGFLTPETHNSGDYINYTVQATKDIQAALQDAKQPEEITELVAAMFDAGFCTHEQNPDPRQWIDLAQAAVWELKGL